MHKNCANINYGRLNKGARAEQNAFQVICLDFRYKTYGEKNRCE